MQRGIGQHENSLIHWIAYYESTLALDAQILFFNLRFYPIFSMIVSPFSACVACLVLTLFLGSHSVK